MKTLLVIFGITGDLSSRKLLPALSHIITNDPDQDLSILGVSRREADVDQLVLAATSNQKLADRTELFTMNLSELNDYTGLKEAIKAYGADQTLLYLSVPSGAAGQIVSLLGEAGINGPDIHLLFEKPFGYDLESAKNFLAQTSEHYSEDQIYRIDHYMAKEISAEIIRLRSDPESRFHNWGNGTIEKVEIVAEESIGIEGRANFYEQTGALRDFIQGHLMQLLSLVLMKTPEDFSYDQLPSLRAGALEALMAANPSNTIRAQYEGYHEEVENPGSTTETFASVLLESSDENWEGVPLRLTTGKALDQKQSFVKIYYKDGATDLFEEGMISSEDHRLLDAYERVLLEAIAGHKALFTTAPEVLRSWEILAPVQKAWGMNSEPLKYYTKGASIESILES